MFTVEIKINGALIGHVYGKNLGVVSGDADGVITKYGYEYYEPEKRKITSGEVKHHRSKGVRPLLTKILNDVEASTGSKGA